MIVFVHLLNDSSGSPKVLMSTIAALTSNNEPAKLFLGSDGNGCLSTCRLPATRYWYWRTGNRVATLFTYLLSQSVLFCKLLVDRTIDRNAVIYVNTLLPFGAALYGRMTGRRVVYHIHEISVGPTLLKQFLTFIARRTSSLNIYVSDAHMQALPIKGVLAKRVYNALDSRFAKQAYASSYTHRCDGYFNVLMIASLRDYKGIPELLAVAKALCNHTSIRFELLVNDDKTAVDRYFSSAQLPGNVAVHACTPDTTPFYARAGLVLNLSRVDQWVETFGMTILEAMAFGVPVIVPPVGGPAELVTNGIEGYLIDSTERSNLCQKILELADDAALCSKLSDASRLRARAFSVLNFEKSLRDLIAHITKQNR